MFFKILKYDFKNGLIKEKVKFLYAGGLSLFLCFDVFMRFIFSQPGAIKEGTFADYIFYIFGGMPEFDVSQNGAFNLPALWILVLILLLFIVLYYPYNDITGFGKHVLINARSRTAWWLSKCVWSIACAVIYFFVIFLVVGVFCLFTKMSFSADVSDFMIRHFVQYSVGTKAAHASVILQLFLLPFLVVASIGLMQLTLSLIIKPVFSYCFSIAVLVASAYYMHPLLIGNYAMTIRSSVFAVNGMDECRGIIYTLLLSAVSVVAGTVIFNHYDVLNREQ